MAELFVFCPILFIPLDLEPDTPILPLAAPIFREEPFIFLHLPLIIISKL
jgi:hypothetical protein